MWKLTLYSKPGCCLCDEAKEAVFAFSRECPLMLEVVDITSDKQLWELYHEDIPVLLLNGKEIARHRIDVKKLRVIRRRFETADECGYTRI